MRILAVDTALGACSTAVLDGQVILGHQFEAMERGHAERLAPMVRDTMQAAQVDFASLERLAVTVGPGTFTGQRVGYAFMRALHLALKRPLVGVTTLEAMAEAAMKQTKSDCAAAIHDAKRGEVYIAAIESGRTVVPVQIAGFEDAVRMVSEAARESDKTYALAGTASTAAAPALRDRGTKVVKTEIVVPDALWVARMAVSVSESESIPRPLYLRPPDARPSAADISPIRPGTLEDLGDIARLHGECFADAWDIEFLGRLLAQPGAFGAIAREQRLPVGFVLGRANAGEAEILSLGVRPSSRRRALGTALVRNALDRAAKAGAGEVFLEVAVENEGARALYTSLGFREVGTRRSYYPREAAPRGDALVLRRSLR